MPLLSLHCKVKKWSHRPGPAGRRWLLCFAGREPRGLVALQALSRLRRREAASGAAPGEKHLLRGPRRIPAGRTGMRARQQLRRAKRSTKRNLSSAQPRARLRLYKIRLNFPILELLQKENIGERDLSIVKLTGSQRCFLTDSENKKRCLETFLRIE